MKGLPKYATRKNDGRQLPSKPVHACILALPIFLVGPRDAGTVAVGFARNRTKGSGNSPGGDVGICIPVIHVMNFSSDPKEDQEVCWDGGEV